MLSAQTEELEKNLCFVKWHKSYWRAGDGQSNFYSMPVTFGHWVIFYPDGTTKVSDGPKPYFGEWKFDPKRKMLITIDRQGLNQKKIVRLTESEFVYRIIVPGGETEYGFKKME